MLIPKKTFLIFISSVILFFFTYFFFFDGKLLSFKFGLKNIFLITLIISLMQLFYQLNRSYGSFFKGQLFYNMWRIFLLVGIYFVEYRTFESVTNLTIFVLFIGFIVSFLFSEKKIKLVEDEVTYKKNLKILGPIFLSIAIITFLGMFDKIFVDLISKENSISISFDDYFYFATIYLGPISLVAHFIGFQEGYYFKNNLNREILFNKLYIYSLFIIVFEILWSLALMRYGSIIRLYGIPEHAFLLLGIVGIFKIQYSVLSAVFIAKSSPETIMNSLYFFIFASIILSLFFLNFLEISFINILIIFAFFWFIRVISALINIMIELKV